jgi:hypothetical protein
MQSISPISALAALLVVPICAHDAEHSQSGTSPRLFNTQLAILRDYPHSKVRPCLIGFPSCESMYPLPTPCLASTKRCPGDAHLQMAKTEIGNQSGVP